MTKKSSDDIAEALCIALFKGVAFGALESFLLRRDFDETMAKTIIENIQGIVDKELAVEGMEVFRDIGD